MRKDIVLALEQIRNKHRNAEDLLLDEVNRILIAGQFSEKNVLRNLKSYMNSFELANETISNSSAIFVKREIEKMCIENRLRFLDSKELINEIPYEAILKIKEINQGQGKDLKHFKIISTREFILGRNKEDNAALFAQTVYGNYLLIHQWGNGFSTTRKAVYFPVRSFEKLFLSVLFLSLIITFILPTSLITTDYRADYFSMYRMACFFHVTIFVTSFTVFGLFSFHSDLSNRNWDSIR